MSGRPTVFHCKLCRLPMSVRWQLGTVRQVRGSDERRRIVTAAQRSAVCNCHRATVVQVGRLWTPWRYRLWLDVRRARRTAAVTLSHATQVQVAVETSFIVVEQRQESVVVVISCCCRRNHDRQSDSSSTAQPSCLFAQGRDHSWRALHPRRPWSIWNARITGLSRTSRTSGRSRASRNSWSSWASWPLRKQRYNLHFDFSRNRFSTVENTPALHVWW